MPDSRLPHTEDAPYDLASPPAAGERASDRLLAAVADGPATVTIGELTHALGDRAFGLALLLLALPNCVPTPPGIGGFTGLFIALFAGQMLLGWPAPWLPPWLGRRGFDRATLRRILLRVAPSVHRVERIAQPRLGWVLGRSGMAVLAVAILVLAAVISMPVPLTNWVPGLGLAAIAIGLIARDGAAVLLGLGIGAIGIGIAVSATGALVVLAAQWFTPEIN